MRQKPRKIRLPNKAVELLRDLRDSYITPRPIPSMINAALRMTRASVVTDEELVKVSRAESTVIDAVLDDEFTDLDHRAIVCRVLHALQGLEDKTIPKQIKINRQGITE